MPITFGGRRHPAGAAGTKPVQGTQAMHRFGESADARPPDPLIGSRP